MFDAHAHEKFTYRYAHKSMFPRTYLNL